MFMEPVVCPNCKAVMRLVVHEVDTKYDPILSGEKLLYTYICNCDQKELAAMFKSKVDKMKDLLRTLQKQQQQGEVK
jgi:hypothetical protein